MNDYTFDTKLQKGKLLRRYLAAVDSPYLKDRKFIELFFQ